MTDDSEDTDDSDDLDDFEEFEPEERPRGILTKEDRRFLRGEKDVGEQARRDTRYRIRERVENSLEDFSLLSQRLPDEDRDAIFESLSELRLSPVSDALAFFYLGVEGVEGVDREFENLLARSIKQAMMYDDPEQIIDVTVDIEVDKAEPDVDIVVDRLIDGEGTLNDFNYAVVKGNIVPVLEHYLEQEEGLQLTASAGAQEGRIEFPLEQLEGMRELYTGQFDGNEEAE